MAFDISVALPGGVTANAGDVVRYDGVTYSVEFDASAEGVPEGVKVDAVTTAVGGNLVLSFNTSVALSGNTFDDEDLVEFDGISFSGLFDGSGEGIVQSLDLDGAHIFESNGNLALSFDTSGTVGGVTFDDEDVLEFTPGAGTWEMAWDTSVERAEWSSGADVDALQLVPEAGAFSSLCSGGVLLAWLRRRRAYRAR